MFTTRLWLSQASSPVLNHDESQAGMQEFMSQGDADQKEQSTVRPESQSLRERSDISLL